MGTPNTLAGMSNPGTAATPVTPAAAPAAIPAPAAATPDQTTPAVPADVQQAANQYQQSVADYQTAAKAPLNVAPVPGIATGPHARLINMISGLALGADAFGKAIATHGREGGVQEVQQANAQKQQMQQSAQQAAQVQRNAELTQKLTTVQTNQQLMQNHIMLARLPQELDLTSIQTQSARAGLQNQIQASQIQLGDFMKQNWGLTPAQVAGTAPAAGSNLAQAKTMLGRYLPNAQTILGADNPAVVSVQKTLDNPTPSVSDIMAAGQGLQTALDQKSQLIAAQTKAADLATAQTKAKYAGPEAEANIASARARQVSAETSQAKGEFELGQEKREAGDLAKPDVTGFSSPLTPKEYDKRYDAFTKSKQYTNLQTAQGSKQQFDDIINQMNKGNYSGADSVVGLFDALGISVTPLQGKGMRINRDVINEHIDARGLDQAVYQKLLALKSGDVITPKQLRDYAGIADGVLYHSFVNAADEAHRQGLPVDFLPQGGGQQLNPQDALIYTDVIRHAHPEYSPAQVKAAVSDSLKQNGWTGF